MLKSRLPNWLVTQSSKLSGLAIGNSLPCRYDSTQSADFDDAELGQRLDRLQRIGEELAVVEDARRARPLEHVVGQDLRPEVLDLLRLREEAVPADVEVEALVPGRAGDAADVVGSASSTVTEMPFLDSR